MQKGTRPIERRLAAILAADVVGYSRLMEQDEAGTFERLRQRRTEIIEPAIARHRGRIFKQMGDGLLAEFASAVDGVECAAAIQRMMEEANRDAPDMRIKLRIGLHVGDVIVEGDDRHGEAVNIAARLQQSAEPGDICVSRRVMDLAGQKVEFGFELRGEEQLKNIADPVAVYSVRSDGAAAKPAPPLPGKPSIAVLPFQNLSADPAQEYFSDGITEDIITELSRFRSLFVTARNSSFVYRGTAVDVRRVGRELGVRFVVEGSVRKVGDRLRIAVQLIEAGTGNHLWADRYDCEVGDLFHFQDEVARRIVATLAGRLEEAELRGAARKRTDSLAAYDCLLRGIRHLRGYAANDNRLARELFEQAIALDPQYALAHAYLALALLVEHRHEDAPEAIKDRAVASGLLAIRLDPEESRAHTFLSQAYAYKGEFEMALLHSERGLALNPNDANGLVERGWLLAMVGRAEEGIELIQQALRLNPFHPDWYWTLLAIALYSARRYEDALEAGRRVAGWKRPWDMARLAACYAQLGRLDEARSQAAEVLRIDPMFRISGGPLSYKDRTDAEHVLDGMRKAGLPD
jgi:adenylate cyclase